MLALEKVLSSFLSLPGFFWSVWLIITIYLFRKGKSAVIYFLSLVSLIIMYVLFTAFGTSFLVVPLENMYLDEMNIESFDKGYPIVVLGGGVYYSKERVYLNPHSLQRVVKGYELYQKLERPIVYSGGVAIGQNRMGESEVAAEWLSRLGVKKEDIIIENQARTTYENAVYVKRWLSEYNFDMSLELRTELDNTVYLVTSALHLPRSVLVFEKQGVDVIPVSSGIAIDHQPSWLDFLPNRGSLTANMMAVHEWLGLLWYKITNRI